MLGAFLTTIFFSLSVIFANRSITAVGLTRANLGRLLVAVICLGAYAHTLGSGLGGAGYRWFLLSGLIGMGLGDLASFNALPLLGSRLAILMSQCLAAPIAVIAERLWLGTRLTAGQMIWGLVILAFAVSAFNVQDGLTSPFQFSLWHNFLDGAPNRNRLGPKWNLGRPSRPDARRAHPATPSPPRPKSRPTLPATP